MKYLKEHWIVVSVLLLSSLTTAFFDFQQLHNFLFAERTEITAEICAEREPFKLCDEANRNAHALLIESTFTGQSYETKIKYELTENSNDPCKPHRYLLDNFSPFLNEETKTYTFPFLTGDLLLINGNGDCADRLYSIEVPSEFVLLNEQRLDHSYLTYIIAGNFRVVEKNQIRGITEFHLVSQ